MEIIRMSQNMKALKWQLMQSKLYNFSRKFWQVTALSWTFFGGAAQGGQKFHWGRPPAPLEPLLLTDRETDWQNDTKRQTSYNIDRITPVMAEYKLKINLFLCKLDGVPCLNELWECWWPCCESTWVSHVGVRPMLFCFVRATSVCLQLWL